MDPIIVQNALRLLSEDCKANLAEGNTIGDYEKTEFSVFRTEFLSILSLLYAASTRVALALKDVQNAHHAAALVPLKDLSNNVVALLHCVQIMRQTQEGLTLLAEYESTARNVISSIDYFAQRLHNSLSAKTNSNDDFVLVAKVHELIENAKKPAALSFDNKAAVRKKLVQDYESLVDVPAEIQEMLKSPASGNEEGPFDDGWEEVGFKSNHHFSREERLRLEKVQALVRLTNLLHKHLDKDLLSPDSPVRADDYLDCIAAFSSRLLVASDNLVSSMYPPHQTSIISVHLREFLALFEKLNSELLPVPKQLSALSGETTKWLAMCLSQITKAGANISETLEIPRQ